VISDNSIKGGVKINATLWGMPAKKFSFKPGTVVAFKGLKIANFRGISLNGGDYTGVFEAKQIGLKEEIALSSWYRTMKDNLDNAKSFTHTEEGEKKSSYNNVRLISEVQNNIDIELRNNPLVRYYINAHVEMVKNDPKMLYMACPKCKKKMVEETAGYNTWN